MTRDEADAVVSDPWRDLIWLVDLEGPMVLGRFNLRDGDEPGRAVEDVEGRVHVVLRGGGAVVSLDLAGGRVLGRRAVCPAPRGIAYDRSRDLLHVVCAGGEVVELPAASGEVTRRRVFASDLRDVVVDRDGSLKVTRFRSAEMLTIDDDGVRSRVRPATVELPSPFAVGFSSANRRPLGPFAATVAWRTTPGLDGSQWMAHQEEFKGHLPETAAHYYGRAVTRTAITRWEDGAPVETIQIGERPLLVDVAVGPGGYLAAAFVGGGVSLIRPEAASSPDLVERERFMRQLGTLVPVGYEQAVAVAWAGRRVVAQMMNPPAIAVFGLSRASRQGFRETFVELGSAPARDVGHDLFHEPTRAHVACASCHPEGMDDGHIWDLGDSGLRRTQPLGGGILETAPFHWGGELSSFDGFLDAVFLGRMGGRTLSEHERSQLGRWVQGIEAAPAAAVDDAAAIERGERLFEGPRPACSACHSGPRGSDGLSHDVGTGGRFQTPTLEGLAQRAPYLHDGRAPTLEARLREHHTEGHGDLRGLDDAAITDLAAYLRSR